MKRMLSLIILQLYLAMANTVEIMEHAILMINFTLSAFHLYIISIWERNYLKFRNMPKTIKGHSQEKVGEIRPWDVSPAIRVVT
jgi:hypothetical protein